MALFAPGVAAGAVQGLDAYTQRMGQQQLQAERAQLMQQRAYDLEQARAANARALQANQGAAHTLSGLYAPPPPVGQPPAPGQASQPTVPPSVGGAQAMPVPRAPMPQGQPLPPMGAGGPPQPPQIPPYRTVQGLQNAAPAAPTPPSPGMTPPPATQPQAPTEQQPLTVKRLVETMRANGIPEDQWLPQLERLKPVMDEQNREIVAQISAKKQEEAQLRAQASASRAEESLQLRRNADERAAAKVAPKPVNAGPLDETQKTALDIQSWNYLNTRVLPYRKGTGGGADRNDEVIQNAAKIANDLGMTPEQVSSMPASWKANAGSMLNQTRRLDAIESTLSSFHNNLDTWNSLASGIAPTLGGPYVKAISGDLKKIDFTGIRTLDDMKLRVQQQFNDPTASAIAVAAMAAAMDYGRIMQGAQSNAALAEGMRKDAERLINSSADAKGRAGIMAALESDTEGQVKGLRDQLDKIKTRMSSTSASSPKSAASGAPKVGTVDSGYRFKGGDPSDKNNWVKQ